MSELLGAFLLGNGAILTNVCLLPLYPGLVAFLAAQRTLGRAAPLLGLAVLAGVLSLMVLVGGLLWALEGSFGALLPLVLPALYGAVILFGLLMLLGVNPFERLGRPSAPLLQNPLASAYLYGLLLGPMTLPCAGPVVLSAFLLGAGSARELADGLAYFLAFGLGFGWPLVLLPLLALPLQRRATLWLARRSALLTRLSGLLLVGIGLFGVWTEVLPNR